jgi:predicted ATPase
MFTRIQTRAYRSLRSVDQTLGRFQALVGPNASGKTTFLDVISFLGDLVRGGGKVLDVVRSRSTTFDSLLWCEQGDSFQLAVEAELPAPVREKMADDKQHFTTARYEIEIGIDRFANEIGLNHEAFWLLNGFERPASEQREFFPAPPKSTASILLSPGSGRKRAITNNPDGNANFYADGRKTYNPSFRLGRQTAALANLPADRDSFVSSGWFREILASGVQTLTLNSNVIRKPSPPGLGLLFQTDGSNLPWVIAALRENPPRFLAWLEHVRTALEDIRDIHIVERPEDRHRYMVIEYMNGAKVPSWLVSDGTLRLLALTIPAYLEDLDGTFLIEEPENGIHPRAMETVLQSLSSIYGGQVLIATHSPVALNMLKPEEILCFAKDASGATDIVSGNHHPALRDWKRGQPNLGTLFAAGILS